MSAALVEDLIDRFRALYKGAPDWAWPVCPSIPLIGQHFKPKAGMLIYGSAENLAHWPNRRSLPSYFDDDKAWNRYRLRYEDLGRNSRSFFPDVGIQPVTDGGLLAAALFVAEHCGTAHFKDPREFLEHIGVSNWCKFTINRTSNDDYIGNVRKLTESIAFVVAELAVLRPAVVILPKQLCEKRAFYLAMRGASPDTRFIPTFQFNSQVVNIHLAKLERAARTLQRKMHGKPLARWMNELQNLNQQNAWRYLASLECGLAASSSV